MNLFAVPSGSPVLVQGNRGEDQTVTLPNSADRTARRLTNIQVLRFMAAAFVVLYHSMVYLGNFVGKPPVLDVFNGRWGFYGVALFFAISGFFMSDLLRKTDCWTFILHRAGRIYPLYYMICVVSLAIVSLFPWKNGFDVLGLWLVPAGRPHASPLGIEWTLVFELAFYVLLFFISLLGLALYIDAVASFWLAAILLTTWFAPEWQNDVSLPVQTLLLSSMNVGFVGGLLLPSLMRRAVLWPFALLVAAPMALLSLRAPDLHAFRWMGGLSVVLIVGAAAQMPQLREDNIIFRLLVRLGDFSYVTYLVHPSVMYVVFQIKEYKHPLRAWVICLASIYTITLAAGPLDIGLYRIIKRKIDELRSVNKRRWALAYVGLFSVGCIVGTIF